jgi:transcriptional regulator with XRE-family HTH domain
MKPIDVSERLAIARRLKQARVKAGVSQEKVARMMNLHRPTISALEAGARRLAAEEIVPITRLLGVSVAWLLEEEAELTEGMDGIARLNLPADALATSSTVASP